MKDQFDEVAKGLAQSVTPRGALKKFGLGLAGLALAWLGFANQAEAGGGKGSGKRCHRDAECCSRLCLFNTGGSVPCNKRGHCA